MVKATAEREDPVAGDAVLGFMQLMWAVDHELQRVSKRMRSAVGLAGPSVWPCSSSGGIAARRRASWQPCCTCIRAP